MPHKASIEVNGSINDLLRFYKEERRLYGRCPICAQTFRLAEAKITYGKEPPRDLLTKLKKERDALSGQIAELEGKIEELEADHEDELAQNEFEWQTKVDTAVARALDRKIKEVRKQAIAHSKVTTLGKTIERIAPVFSGFGHHPADVRPIFEPVDFVVFSGLFAGEVTDLVIVEFKTGNAQLSRVQRSIRDAVDRGRISFEERRMNSQILRQLAQGRPTPGKNAIELRVPKTARVRAAPALVE